MDEVRDGVKVTTDVEATDLLGMLVRRIQLESPRKGDLRKQAQGEVPMRLAHQAAREAIERSFAMPLFAAGFKDVKVVARFPTEGSAEPSYLDLSTPYNQAIEEAERREAQGRK